MSKFKFSVGPWNVHSGADQYGHPTRAEILFEEKVKKLPKWAFPPSNFTMTTPCLT